MVISHIGYSTLPKNSQEFLCFLNYFGPMVHYFNYMINKKRKNFGLFSAASNIQGIKWA